MEQRTRIVPVELDDGTRIKVRATALGGEEDVAALAQVFPFAQIATTIENIAKTLNATVAKINPDRASIEFGVELAIESGQLSALIVQGSTNGNLKITLEWKKQEPPDKATPKVTDGRTTV